MEKGEESSFGFRERLNKLVLPGFDGLPIRQVITFVLKGFRKGVLVTRASSIAFNLLMALLPASIFLFTLIPFIPVHNFQRELIRLFENILPSNAFNFLETTIIDIVTHKSKGLLLIMFLATVLFSTNGIHAIIHAFVVSAHSFKSRSWLHQRKISVILLMIVIFLTFSGGMLIMLEKVAVNRLVEYHIIKRTLVINILVFLKWLVIILLVFLTISFLYYYAPARRSGFRFFSAGSTLATFLFLLTSLGFSAYVNKFGQYNKLYGSIGTLMVILIWLYLNSIAILIGFELNVSIMAARDEDSKKEELSEKSF
ncbi:MAG: YihY/virulence factor BrkB family protein [Bacteroidales bacterium]|nr:YihY/virulence factor BrkB family protein [Bacteroidales bacterium]MBK8883228.1 YihY/virulence factor BrkB family protein [Bacteroidales bacterium]